MRYRKKSVEIEAKQFDGTEESALKISEELDMYQDAWDYSVEGMILHTLKGDMVASKGDWIIKGVQGEFYPCKPDIFDLTYDKVE
jgi:hypothetical protein